MFVPKAAAKGAADGVRVLRSGRRLWFLVYRGVLVVFGLLMCRRSL